MTIRAKLLLTMLGIGCVGIAISGYIGYRYASRGLTDAALRQLTGVRRSKAQQIEAQFATWSNHAVSLSADRMLIDAMAEFRAAIGNTAAYARAHAKYDPALTSHRAPRRVSRPVPDRSRNRHIVYSVLKQPDFGTSLVRGPYREYRVSAGVPVLPRNGGYGRRMPDRL